MIEHACPSCGVLFTSPDLPALGWICPECDEFPQYREGEADASFQPPGRCGYCVGGYVHTVYADGAVIEDICDRCHGTWEA